MDNGIYIFVNAQGLNFMLEQMVRLVSLGIVSRIQCKSIIGNLIDVEKEEVETPLERIVDHWMSILNGI